jgi:hypothetical protein
MKDHLTDWTTPAQDSFGRDITRDSDILSDVLSATGDILSDVLG